MIRNITIIVLLLAVALQSFNSSLVIVNYKLNTEFYLRNCINKNKPQLKCHGKCQMAKQLQQAEQQNKDAADKMLKSPTLDLYCTNTTLGQIPVAVIEFSPGGFPLSIGHPLERSGLIFHPPSGC